MWCEGTLMLKYMDGSDSSVIIDGNCDMPSCMHEFESFKNISKHNVRKMIDIIEVMTQEILNIQKTCQDKEKLFYSKSAQYLEYVESLLNGKKSKYSRRIPRVINCSSETPSNVLKGILKRAPLPAIVPSSFVFNKYILSSMKKIAEGSFGEIFTMIFPNETHIMKLIPVGSCNPVTTEKQLTLSDISSEINISWILNDLSNGKKYKTTAFSKVFNIQICQGALPEIVNTKCKQFKDENGSRHPLPEYFSPLQHFAVIETEHCGTPLEDIEFLSYPQACSLFIQFISALSVAEEAHFYEHRDAHMGNLLIKQCPTSEKVHLTFRKRNFTFNSNGMILKIIDYTYSRCKTNEFDVQFLNLSDIANVKENKTQKWKDNRHVYYEMTCMIKENWRGSYPITNLYWAKYLIKNLLKITKNNYDESIPESEKVYVKQLNKFDRKTLNHHCCVDLFLDVIEDADLTL